MSWRFGLSLLVLDGASRDPIDAETRNPRLSLTWSDPYRQIPWDSGRVFEEVQDLLLGMGVEVDWSTGKPIDHDTAVTKVWVLLRPNESEELGVAEHAMGAVLNPRGSRNTVFVFVPNVLRTLGHRNALGLSTSPKSRSQINRAVARVITHELIHTVLPGRAHDARGLFSAHLDRRLLLARKLEVDGRTVAALVLRLNHAQP